MQYVPLWTTILRSRKVFNLDDASFRFWVNCLALAQDHDGRRGTLPDLDSIAFALRLDDDEASRLMGRLIAAGLIDDDGTTCVVHNWKKWKYKPDPTGAARKRNQRLRQKSDVTDVTGQRDSHVCPKSHAIQNSTETEQKAGKPAAHARPRTHEASPEVIPIAPRPDPAWEPQPLPDESMTGRSGADHADFIRAVQVLDSHHSTRRLGMELRMHSDTPGVRMLQGWQFVCGAFNVQRPDRNRTWGALTGFARNATQAEFDKLNAQAPARASPAASPPVKTDAELRAQTEEGNRKVAEYLARKRACE